MATIATHNGSQAHRQHNIRDEKVVSKEEHIKPGGIYEIWKDEKPREAYHKLFDRALKEYNEKQTRADRQIKDYYKHICQDDKKHPVYEMIVGIYPQDNENISQDTQKQIMREFVEAWQVRNPSLYLCGAYYHADEEGQPHVHLDYIPVARGYTKGMKVQNGLVKALGEMGFSKQGKETAQIQWQRKENEYLEKLCKAKGIEIEHPVKEKQEHIETSMYKAHKELDRALDNTKELLDIKDSLNGEIQALTDNRDRAEKQAEKAIERKRKAFSRSFKKDKDRKGWEYNRSLEKEIRNLVEDRKQDADRISNTNMDVWREYEKATNLTEQARTEAKQMKEQAEKELKAAEKYKTEQEAYILNASRNIADRMFQEFLEKEFSEKTKGRAARLEKFCKDVKYQDGSSVLDRFNKAETERKQALARSWEWER